MSSISCSTVDWRSSSGKKNIFYLTKTFQDMVVVAYYCNLLCYVKCSTPLLTFKVVAMSVYHTMLTFPCECQILMMNSGWLLKWQTACVHRLLSQRKGSLVTVKYKWMYHGCQDSECLKVGFTDLLTCQANHRWSEYKLFSGGKMQVRIQCGWMLRSPCERWRGSDEVHCATSNMMLLMLPPPLHLFVLCSFNSRWCSTSVIYTQTACQQTKEGSMNC